jgi:hypothetical protein
MKSLPFQGPSEPQTNLERLLYNHPPQTAARPTATLHQIILSRINILVRQCELILKEADLNKIQSSNIESALYYLRKLL